MFRNVAEVAEIVNKLSVYYITHIAIEKEMISS